MPFRNVILLVLAGTALGLVPAAAQVRQPMFADLTAVYPAGGQRGQVVPITIDGEYLSDPSRVLVTGDGIEVRSLRGVSEREVRAELVLAKDAAPGVRAVRVVSRFGVSDPAWFVVGTLPEALETEPNQGAERANSVPVPCVVNGRLKPGQDLDYFRFPARAGQPLVLAVTAFTIDAQTHSQGGRFLDTTLTISDSSGRVLTASEDYTTLDPALAFTAPSDGEYVAEVRDMGYLGNERAFYRLTLAPAPYPFSVFPAGGQRGTRVRFQAGGLNVPADAGGEIAIPADAPAGPRWIMPLEQGAAAVPFLVGDLPEILEQEPNDAAAQANPCAFPVTVNGRLQKDGDEDRYALALKKGEGIAVEITAGRVLRSPVDLQASILDAAGRVLQENDDNPFTVEATSNRRDSLSGDPRLEFVAPQDGRYILAIRDLADRGGPHCIYRATITRRRPGFDLTTWYDNPSIKGPGGTGVILVLLQRWGGFSGWVRVRVGGLPPGYTGSDAVIPRVEERSNPTATVLTITAPPDAAPGAVIPFWIEGEAEIEGEKFVTRARPRAHLGQNSDHSLFRASETCLACVTPVDQAQVSTEVRSVSGAAGETVRIPVTIRRQADFKGELALFALRGLPISFGPPVTIPAGADRFEFPLAIPKDLSPGQYSFALCRPIYGDFRIDRPHTSTPVLTLTVTGPVGGAGGGPKK